MKIYKYTLFLMISLLIINVINNKINNSNDEDNSFVYASEEIIDNEVEETDDNDTYIGSEVLDVVYGKLSRYGPDCYGCSGYLAYGKYVGNGIIHYNDSYYGNVRILAGDRSYPFGTIVRVSFNGESFLGIVLDRGGVIGFNKAALFDLLYPSEYLANIDGVNYNTKFEILRVGF